MLVTIVDSSDIPYFSPLTFSISTFVVLLFFSNLSIETFFKFINYISISTFPSPSFPGLVPLFDYSRPPYDVYR